MADIKKHLGDRVRAERERAGLTQAKLAEAAGITDETVSRIERGRFEPSISTVLALSAALGTDLLAATAVPLTTHKTSTPLLRRLHSQLAELDEDAQSAMLRVAELLAERTVVPARLLKVAESGAGYGKRKPKRRTAK